MKIKHLLILSRILLIFCSLLLIITGLGHFQLIGFDSTISPVSGSMEKFKEVPVYSIQQVLDYVKVRTPIASNKKQETVIKIFDLITERFYHRLANHTFYTNYLIWSVSLLKKEWLPITDTESLLKYSRCAQCNQSAQALVDIYNKIGIKARIVHLIHHIVMEVYYENDWHMLDPDYEVIPKQGNKIFSVKELKHKPALIENFYKNNPHTHEGKSMVRRITTIEENSAYFKENTNISPRVFKAHKVLEVFKWIIPILGIFISIFIYPHPKNRNDSFRP